MQYLTINATAKSKGIPAGLLRSMLKKKTLPGFQYGNRFLVNVDLLMAQLEWESKESVSTDSTTAKS